MDPRYFLGPHIFIWSHFMGPIICDPNLGPDISGPYLGSNYGPNLGPLYVDLIMVQLSHNPKIGPIYWTYLRST